MKLITRWWMGDETTNIATQINKLDHNSCTRMPATNQSAKADHYSKNGDIWIYRIVVTALGSTVLLCTLGAISLELGGKSTPSLVSSLGTGSLAAIAGLLVPSPIKR